MPWSARPSAPIANHQAIQFMLADMAVALEATRCLLLKAADGRSGAGSTRRIEHGCSMAPTPR